MSEYHPDAWVILKLSDNSKTDETTYKVLAGWYGGYTGSDSWQLNSGITQIVEQENHYEIMGFSGSVYFCHKNEERLTGLTSSTLSSMERRAIGTEVAIERVEIESILEEFRKC